MSPQRYSPVPQPPRQPAQLLRPRLMAVAVASCFAVTPAFGLPTGGQVVAGSARFAQTGNSLVVTNTPGAIINWNSFSVGAIESVKFQQQNSLSAVLNRVTGSGRSDIQGALLSNGRVFLINPNGILFGPNSTVNVGGLIASTLDIADPDFKDGKLKFAAGASAGSLQNAGTLAAGKNIYLIAPDIENTGIIQSAKGEILLAAGRQVTLVDGAHPDIQVVISAPSDKAVNLGELAAGKIGVFGALVQQKGIANADRAEVDAKGRIVFRATKQLDIEAGSRTTANGKQGGDIVLQATEGDTYVKGTVEATGEVDAGGTVQVLGQRVAVMDQAGIDASGAKGGGTILVGGDYQGKNPDVQNSTITYFGPEATLKANAGTQGDGGTVIVWADDTTRAYGSIEAKGGATKGNGGFVETSGKERLSVQGARVDTRATNGDSGTWLLDPRNVTITSAGSTVVAGTPFEPATDGESINAATIITQLANGNITITTGDGSSGSSPGSEAGNITVSAPISWSTTNALTLLARGDIAVNADISCSANANVTLLSGWNESIGSPGVDAAGGISINNASIATGGLGVVLLQAGSTGISTTGTGTGTSGAFLQGKIALQAAGPISVSKLDGDFVAHATGYGSAITIGDPGGMSVSGTAIGGLAAGVSTNNGAIQLEAGGGLLYIAGPVDSSGGNITLSAPSGPFSVPNGSSVDAGSGDIDIAALDITLGGTLSGANIEIARSSAGTIGLGLATGDMTLSGSELQNVSASTLTLTAPGDLLVNGVGSTDSLGIGTVILRNDGANNNYGITLGAASSGTASFFSALDVRANSGIYVYNDVTVTEAGLSLDANANATANWYDDILVSGANGAVKLEAAGTLTIGNAAHATSVQQGSAYLGNNGGNVTLSGNTVTLNNSWSHYHSGGTAHSLTITSGNGGTQLKGGISTTGDLLLTSTGSVTQDAAINVAGLELLGAGGSYTLTHTGNTVSTLAGDTGSVSFVNNGSLAIGSVGSTSGVLASGSITLAANGATSDITLSGASISGDDITLTAGRDIKLASNYVENQSRITASNNLSITTGRDLVLEATRTIGNEDEGGIVWIKSTGGQITADIGGALSVTAYGSDTAASIEGYSGVAIATAGNASLHAYGGTAAYGASVELYSANGNVGLTSYGSGGIALTAADDSSAEIWSASGSIVLTATAGGVSLTNTGAVLVSVGGTDGTSITGTSATLYGGTIADSGDIAITVSGNIVLDAAAVIESDSDVILTLTGSSSQLSLAGNSTITSVASTNPIGGQGATTYVDFTTRTTGGIVIDGTAYSSGAAGTYGGSGIFYFSAPWLAGTGSGYGGLAVWRSSTTCASGWYCWDGGGDGVSWGSLANWTAVGGATGSDPTGMEWTTSQLKIGTGFSTTWDSVPGSAISALQCSGSVTVNYGGPVSIGNLTLAGGALTGNVSTGLTLGTLTMNASSTLSGFATIAQTSLSTLNLAGNVSYGGALTITSSGGIAGTATIYGGTSVSLAAYGGAIGSSGTPLKVITPSLSALANGSDNIYGSGGIWLETHSSTTPLELTVTSIQAPYGGIVLDNYGALVLGNLSAYGGIAANAHSPVTVNGTISSSSGSVSLASSSGDPLTINGSAQISASTGVALTAGSGGAITVAYGGSVSTSSGTISTAGGSVGGTGTIGGVAANTVTLTTNNTPASSGSTTTPIDPCVINPGSCTPVDPCIANPGSCTPVDPCIANPGAPGCGSSGGGVVTPTDPLGDKLACLINPASCSGGGTPDPTVDSTVKTALENIGSAEQTFTDSTKTGLTESGNIELALAPGTAPNLDDEKKKTAVDEQATTEPQAPVPGAPNAPIPIKYCN